MWLLKGGSRGLHVCEGVVYRKGKLQKGSLHQEPLTAHIKLG